MNYSNVFKCSVAVILLLSIGWKISARNNDQDSPNDSIIQYLERRHFNAVVTEKYGLPIIQANSASCQLQIAVLRPDGSDRDLVRGLVTGTDRLFVVFRGRVYAKQPVFWTELNFLWSKFLRELGLARHIAPVIAVAAEPSCNADGFPWDELS